MAMWDEAVDAAIDEVARELTSARKPDDGSARVLARLEHSKPHVFSWWPFAVAGAVLTVAAGIAVGILRGRAAQPPAPNPAPSVASQAPPVHSLVWVDRQGREEPTELGSVAYESVRLSPDGRTAALGIRNFRFRNEGNDNIWLVSFVAQAITPLTRGGLNTSPVWTPDGRRIIFASDQDGGQLNVWRQTPPGSGPPERLTTSPNSQAPSSVTPDGRTIIVQEDVPGAGTVLLLLPIDGQPSVTLLRSPFSEGGAEVSPDGRWLADRSNESGRNEIYVRPFPSVTGGRWQVSVAGGTVVHWGRNGRELFYMNGGKLMTASVTAGDSFAVSKVTELFEGPYADNFDVAPDGQRFLMMKTP
jgi:hypothetical protein